MKRSLVIQSAIAGLLFSAAFAATEVFDNVSVPFFGQSNFLPTSGGNVAIGSINSVNTTSGYSIGLAVGWNNQIQGGDTLAGGSDNVVSGHVSGCFGHFISVPAQAPAPGQPWAHNWGAFLVGRYNNTVEYNNKTVMFSVGVGEPGEGNRKNGLSVFKDGDVVIPKPQGDISMGNYTTP